MYENITLDSIAHMGTYEEFLKIISTPKFICNYTSADNKAAQLTFTNTNRYINGEHKPKLDTLIIGGKTGYTSEAGRCLVLLSRDEDNNSYTNKSIIVCIILIISALIYLSSIFPFRIFDITLSVLSFLSTNYTVY